MDNRNITLNFVISLSREFLSLQIIYGGKTKASQSRGIDFPPEFSVTQNPKHWLNENKTLKLLDQVINSLVCVNRILG